MEYFSKGRQEKIGSDEKILSAEEKRTLLAKRELFRTLGLEIDSIRNPENAPLVVDFAKFWDQAGYKDRGIVARKEYETYVGSDYRPRKGIIEVAEVTKGEQFSVMPKVDHFIEMHTEPGWTDFISPSDELHNNLPDVKYSDMFDFLNQDVVFCSIIIRMIGEKQAGVVLALKTDVFAKHKLPLRVHTSLSSKLKNKMQGVLDKDKILTLINGAAIYRGFVDLPPKKGRAFLRLRKPF